MNQQLTLLGKFSKLPSIAAVPRPFSIGGGKGEGMSITFYRSVYVTEVPRYLRNKAFYEQHPAYPSYAVTQIHFIEAVGSYYTFALIFEPIAHGDPS